MKGPTEVILIMGAFNPPTIAHVKMSEVLHKEYPDDVTCYVVAGDKYLRGWKGYNNENILPFDVREKLLEDATSEKDYALVSSFENSAKSDGKTITTVEFFKKIGYHEGVSLCVGSDNLKDFDKWYRCEDIVDSVKSIIILCRGVKKEDGLNLIPDKFKDKADKFRFIDFNYDSISSSKIREAARNHNLESVKEDVPDNVYEFLIKNYENGGEIKMTKDERTEVKKTLAEYGYTDEELEDMSDNELNDALDDVTDTSAMHPNESYEEFVEHENFD
jgi:nicotinate (nicotinamide) nucleotide adenylyltransferase